MIKKINIVWLSLIPLVAAAARVWLQNYFDFLRNWKAISILIILLALLFALFSKEENKKIALIIPLSFLIVSCIQIILDIIAFPTSHNLWPFEIILLAITAFASAWIGVGIGFVLKKLFYRSGNTGIKRS